MKENLKKILITGPTVASAQLARGLTDLESEIILLDKLDQMGLAESYANIPYKAMPELDLYGGEKKKKKPCTYHEYTERQNKEWICRHCEHPLK